MQDEVEFVVSNFDFALQPGQALNKYMHHRYVLGWLLALNAIYEVCLGYYIVRNRDFMLAQLGEIYRNLDMESITQVFITCYSVDTVVTVITFGLGFYALYSHKTKYYHWFNNMLLLSVFLKIIVSYLNVLNLLVFILKIVLFLYARFLLSILYTVLVIPNEFQV